jgi:hypothetical protein
MGGTSVSTAAFSREILRLILRQRDVARVFMPQAESALVGARGRDDDHPIGRLSAEPRLSLPRRARTPSARGPSESSGQALGEFLQQRLRRGL